jgi:hypothetical protein
MQTAVEAGEASLPMFSRPRQCDSPTPTRSYHISEETSCDFPIE